MAFPHGLFTTPNLVRVSNPKAATRPFSSEAVRVSGNESPRVSYHPIRQPALPPPAKLK